MLIPLLLMSDVIACANGNYDARTDYIALAIIGSSGIATIALAATSALDFAGFLPRFGGSLVFRLGTLGAMTLSGAILGLVAYRMMSSY